MWYKSGFGSGNGSSEEFSPNTLVVNGDGSTVQTFDDGRTVTVTKTATGFREVEKDSSGNTTSDITITVNGGTIRSENTTE